MSIRISSAESAHETQLALVDAGGGHLEVGSAAVVTHGRARQAAWVSEARVSASGWPGWLTGEEQAAPGVGEEVLVAFGAPAPLAYQELVELGGVGRPDDVGGVGRVDAQ
jgi:hypothetical protein